MRRAVRHLSVMVGVGVLLGSGVAAPVRAQPAGPASPTGLTATNGASSISLNWAQPATGTRPISFRVYEGATVVARNTTTRVTVPDLAFGSTHTYRVTAVDDAGRESAPSAPTTRQAMLGGPFACGMTIPGAFTVTEVTSSAVSLSWSNAVPYYDQQGTIVVLRDSEVILQTTLDSARIGGLAPGATHTFQVARRDCLGQLHSSPPLTVTTAAGPSARPTAPSGLVVGTRTATSIRVSWTGSTGTAAVAGYAVYEGATRVATTSATAAVLGGLWRDTSHQYTVAALDAAGNESGHTAPVETSTLTCPDPPATPNAPTRLTATAVSPSSVALSWTQDFEATSFTVYRVSAATLPLGSVATTRTTAAMITGLPSASTASYAVVAQTVGCGQSPLSVPVKVSTPAGPGARPSPPADLRVIASTPNFDFTAAVTLGWSQPAGADPPVGFRVYEGTTVLGTSATTGLTLRLPGGPTHSVTVVAVDAAGNESAPSNPVVFVAPFLPPP